MICILLLVVGYDMLYNMNYYVLQHYLPLIYIKMTYLASFFQNSIVLFIFINIFAFR